MYHEFLFTVADALTQTFRYFRGFCAIGGLQACKAQAFFSNVLMILSMLLVLLMSAERFWALKLPFYYYNTFSMQKTGLMILALFAYSVCR